MGEAAALARFKHPCLRFAAKNNILGVDEMRQNERYGPRPKDQALATVLVAN